MPSEWLYLLQGRHPEFKKHLLSMGSGQRHIRQDLCLERDLFSFFLPSSLPFSPFPFYLSPPPPRSPLFSSLKRKKNNGNLEKASLGEPKWLASSSSFRMDVDLGLSLVYYSYPWTSPMVVWGISEWSSGWERALISLGPLWNSPLDRIQPVRDGVNSCKRRLWCRYGFSLWKREKERRDGYEESQSIAQF